MLTKSSPLLGYNNNVRHGGRVFHIQTEDSGIRYGHVISHVFADGGRILKSVKTSYAKYVGDDRMVEIVREMMRQQHKAMFIALRDGVFDVLMDGSPASGSLAPSVSGANSVPASSVDGRGECVATDPPPSAYRPVGPALPAASTLGSDGQDAAAMPRPRLGDPDALLADGIERSVERIATSSWTAEELPPPPAHLLCDNAGEIDSHSPALAHASLAQPLGGAALSPAANASLAMPAHPPSERRYASTRPASIFGQARPQSGTSVFGADVARDKLLDEVILSFLAADDEPASK
jgi:hypothetical protein